jgi:hypothetical protein
VTSPAENETVLQLLSRVHGDLHENTVVKVTVSSQWNEFNPRALLDFDNEETYFISQDEPGQWICYDFLHSGVHLTSYYIRSSLEPQNSGHLRNWTVEASNDGMNWTQLDSRTDDHHLNGPGAVAVFDIQNPSDHGYRYVRLRQEGPNHGFYDQDRLMLSGFDMGGKLVNCTNPAREI